MDEASEDLVSEALMRSRCARLFARLPQADIRHQLPTRFLEAS